jgi:hypothetical protein
LAEVKFDGTGTTSDMILNGTYNTDHLDTASTLFIKHMTRQSVEDLTSSITEEEFLGKLRSWPEAMSTSPSGIHLGHYHALWKTLKYTPHTNPTETKLLEQSRALRIRAHLALLNYAVKFGYSYDRWHKIINVMLKKDPLSSHIHKL